jgi:hypothetical protein
LFAWCVQDWIGRGLLSLEQGLFKPTLSKRVEEGVRSSDHVIDFCRLQRIDRMA